MLARLFGLPASNQTAYEPQRDCPLALLRRNQVPPMRGLGRRRGYLPRMLSQRRLRGDCDCIPVNALGTYSAVRCLTRYAHLGSPLRADLSRRGRYIPVTGSYYHNAYSIQWLLIQTKIGIH